MRKEKKSIYSKQGVNALRRKGSLRVKENGKTLEPET